MKRRIIDNRRKSYFTMDDKYLNGFAKKCGWQATLVYLCLCRHASKEQESFPSIALMKDKLGIGRNSVMKGIKQLEFYNIIEIEKKKNKKSQWLNNSYILIDKSEWKSHVLLEDMDKKPCPSQNKTMSLSEQNHVPLEDTKYTHRTKHIEPNTLCTSNDDADMHQKIVKIFDLFKEINPMINYGHKTNRKSCESLIKQIGFEKLIRTVEYLISIQGVRYAPRITTPYQLEQKFGDLVSFYRGETENQKVSNIEF